MRERLVAMNSFTRKLFNQLNSYVPILLTFLAVLLSFQTIDAAPKNRKTLLQGTPATLTPVSGSGQSTVVNTTFPNQLKVIVQDAGGNTLSNVAVTFTAPTGSPTTTPTAIFTSTNSNTVTVNTDSTGAAIVPTGMVKASQKAGQYNISVTAGSASSTILLINAPGAPATITVSQGAGQMATIGTTLPITFVALVADSFANPVPGTTVIFTAPSSGPSGLFQPTSSLTDTQITNSSGLATAKSFQTNTVAGVYNVVANTSPTPLAQPANFNLQNLPGNPTQISISQGNNQSTQVTTAFGTLLRVLVRDASNNPVPNVSVTFTAPATGVSGTFAGGSATFTVATDSAGLATATTFTANTVSGTYTVSAAITGASVNFSLTNTPGAAASIAVNAGNNQTTTITLSFATSLSVIVKDANNNPVSGQTVTFTAPGTGPSGTFGAATTTTATTNASGIATATTFKANSIAGTYLVTVTLGALSTSFTLTNVNPASITVNAGSPQTAIITLSFTTALSVKVADAGGTGIAGLTVTFTAPTTGASGTFGGLATTMATTNASGIATATTFTANAITGPYTVTATVAGLTANFSLTNAAPTSINTQVGNNQTTTINTAFPTRLTARALNGTTGIAGLSITFTIVPGGGGASGTFTGGGTTNTVTTNTSGDAQSAVITANGTTGTFTVTAVVTGTSTPIATFTLTNIAPAAASITATAGTPQSTTINTTFGTNLAAVVKDINGVVLSGQSVTFTINTVAGATGTFAGGASTLTVTTNASGVATATAITANGTGGTYTVTATVGALSATFTLTNIPPNSVTVSQGSGQVTLISTSFGSALVVIVKDVNGNPLSGVPVIFTAPASGASCTFGGSATTTVTSGAGGLATTAIPVANGTAGNYTVNATVTGVATPAAFTLTNSSPSAITATAGISQFTLINTNFGTALQAKVVDAANNPLPNVMVMFTAPATGASCTFGGATTVTVTTNASGLATTTPKANGTVGNYTVNATVTGVATPATYSLANTTLASLTIVQGTPQMTVINTAFGTALKVKVLDSSNNPAVGVMVTFTAPTTGASGKFTGNVTTTTVTTDSTGTATAPTFTANGTTGMYNVSASVTGLTAVQFSLTNTLANPATAVASPANSTPQSTSVNTAFPINLGVLVKDAGGTIIVGVPVTFTINTVGGATGTFAGGVSTQTVNTNASGIATATQITANGTAGTYTVTVTVGTLTVTFTLSNTAVPASITPSAGNNQSAVIGATFTNQLQATVLDTGGNPVVGAVVNLSAPTTGARCTFGGASTTSGTTNSAGVVTFPAAVAGTVTGTYTLTATVQNTTVTTTFTLTNTPGAPNTITKVSGNNQSSPLGANFAQPLVAVVKDASGNVIPGVSVTFNLPTTGARATFPGGVSSATVMTDSVGNATSPTFTAVGSTGTYNTINAKVNNNTPSTTFTATNNAAAPASIGVQAGSAQTTVVNTNFGLALQAKVLDTLGNPVGSGVTVTFMLPNTGASGTFAGNLTATANTNASGIATSPTLKANTIAGTFFAQATIANSPTPATYTLTNNPDTPVAIMIVSGTPQSTIINTTFGMPLVAIVKDIYGNPVPGTTVNFLAPTVGSVGTFPGPTSMAVTTTDSAGKATSPMVTANGIAGSYTITGSLPGIASVNFNLTNLPNPFSLTIQNGSPQTTPITTPFGQQFQVLVKDSLGQPIQNVIVSFTAPGTGQSGTFPGNSLTTMATTNASGIATAPVFTANTIVGTYNVVATVGALTGNFVLTNTTGAANSIMATGGVTQTTGINTNFGQQLQATVKDAGGNPVPNVMVTFTIGTVGGASAVFANNTNTTTAMTNAQGIATSTTITANGTTGSYTATAMVSGVATLANYNLTNTNNAPGNILATTGGNQTTQILTAFGQQLVSTVTDATNNPVPNVMVTFTVMPGATGASGTFPGNATTATAMTNAQGMATSPVITANNKVGTFIVDGNATGVANPAIFNLTNIAGSANGISATGSTNQTTQVLTQFGQALQATVVDAGNNPVSGVTVTFTLNTGATGASGTFPGNATTATATTNAQGVATSPIVTANGKVGTHNPTAQVTGVATLANYTLNNTAGAPSSISASGNTNQTTKVLTQFGQALQATVVDAGNNPVPNVTVTFTLNTGTSGSSGTFPGNATTATATTNSQGVATSPIVTANGKIGTHNPTAQVSGVATLANYTLNNIVGDPNAISANGNTNQTTKILTAFGQALQATVVDAGNNPVPNVTVTFTLNTGATGASGTFPGNTTTATTTTDSNGVATSPIVTANNKVGTHNPTAQVSGVATLANYTLNNLVGDPNGISANGSTNQTTKVLTQFGQALQATVVDAGNNPVPNVTVTFTLNTGATGASGTFPGNTTTATVTTDSNGVATSPMVTANGKVGTHNPTAQVSGVATLANYTLNNLVGDPNGIVAVGTSTQTTKVLTQFTNPLKALVQDLAGNPVPNVQVTFTIGNVGGASGSFVGNSQTLVLTTGADGTVTTTMITANGVIGTYQVNATVTGIATPLTYTLTNLAGDPSGIAIVGTSEQVTRITTAFGDPLQAKVTDLAGNPIPNIPVTFTLPSTQPNGTFPGGVLTATVPTNAAGIATSPIITASSQVGSYFATATAVGINQTLSYRLTNISNPPGSILAVGELEQTTVVTTAFGRTLQALVLDNNGNPVNNVPVVFTMSNDRANGTFTTGNTTTTVNTNTDGIATTPVIVANSIVGTFTVKANVFGVPGTLIYKLNNICSTLTITPQTLPDASLGAPYQAFIKVSDSVNGKVTLSARSQQGLVALPSGMTLDPVTGLLSGNPTQAGVFNFTVVATNEFGCSASKDFSLAVKDPSCKDIVINPKDLNDGIVGTPYSQELTLVADTWTAPLIFEIATGRLPEGLLIDRAKGTIAGVPTAAGNYTFTVVVKSANGCTGVKVYFIRICAVEHKPIFVADMGNNRIQRSDDGGVNWVTIGSLGSGLGQFNSPGGIETNATGSKVFVSDTGNNRIQRSLDGGRTWEIIATFGTQVGQVNSPYGLAYDENNDKLYVADTENSRIQVLTQAGSDKIGSFQIFAGATEGDDIGKMSKPKDVAVNCEGTVYVADTSNNRIQMNATGDRKGWKIFAGATKGRKLGKVKLPVGVFVDQNNVVYVADTANDRVQVNATGSEGAWTVMFDSSEALGAIKAPQGVTVTNKGQVFVTDTANNRLRKKAITGDDTQIGSSGEGQFNNPAGIR